MHVRNYRCAGDTLRCSFSFCINIYIYQYASTMQIRVTCDTIRHAFYEPCEKTNFAHYCRRYSFESRICEIEEVGNNQRSRSTASVLLKLRSTRTVVSRRKRGADDTTMNGNVCVHAEKLFPSLKEYRQREQCAPPARCRWHRKLYRILESKYKIRYFSYFLYSSVVGVTRTISIQFIRAPGKHAYRGFASAKRAIMR